MSAAVTDLLDRVTDSTTGRPVVSALAAPGKAIGASSFNLTDATNWTTTTGIHFSIYKVNAQGYKDPTTQTDWKGVLSGTTVSNLTLTGGTDQAYNAGDIVELTPTARFAKDLYDWGSAHANEDGSLKTSAVQAALNLGNTPAVGWLPIGAVPVYAGNNGNKEYVLNFPLDLTTTLTKGMKMQVTRSVAAPTQCMAFVAANSQYASAPSPAGITFTGDWTQEARIRLNSYGGSAGMFLLNRDSLTSSGSGFGFYITSSGQLSVYWRNASGISQFTSNQSVPLNRWVHVAVSVSASSLNVAFYIDGVAVPFATNSTAATTIVQAANSLYLGAQNFNGAMVSNSYFDGYISEVRLWGAAMSQSFIRANMAINVSAQTNLVALFQGSGTFNDTSGNANNLTATNGASSTQSGNPYNNIEYGFITNVGAYAGGNTPITLFCGTDCNIPNMVLSNPQYSLEKAPYGFPVARNKWIVETLMNTRLNNNGGAVGAWFNLGWQLSIPLSEWDVGYDVYAIATTAAGTSFLSPAVTLSATNNGASDSRFSANANVSQVSSTDTEGVVSKTRPLSLSVQTVYYLNISSLGGTTNGLYLGNNTNLAATYKIQAVLAYA